MTRHVLCTSAAVRHENSTAGRHENSTAWQACRPPPHLLAHHLKHLDAPVAGAGGKALAVVVKGGVVHHVPMPRLKARQLRCGGCHRSRSRCGPRLLQTARAPHAICLHGMGETVPDAVVTGHSARRSQRDTLVDEAQPAATARAAREAVDSSPRQGSRCSLHPVRRDTKTGQPLADREGTTLGTEVALARTSQAELSFKDPVAAADVRKTRRQGVIGTVADSVTVVGHGTACTDSAADPIAVWIQPGPTSSTCRQQAAREHAQQVATIAAMARPGIVEPSSTIQPPSARAPSAIQGPLHSGTLHTASSEHRRSCDGNFLVSAASDTAPSRLYTAAANMLRAWPLSARAGSRAERQCECRIS